MKQLQWVKWFEQMGPLPRFHPLKTSTGVRWHHPMESVTGSCAVFTQNALKIGGLSGVLSISPPLTPFPLFARMSLAPEVSRLAALTLLPLVASLQLQSNNGEAIGASEAEFRQFIAQHQRTGMGIGWGEIKLMIYSENE